MRIGKGKRRVARQCDPLGGRAGQGHRRGLQPGPPRQGAQPRQIDMVAQKTGIIRDGRFQVGMLGRLDQSQVAFGQAQIAPARQGAQHRDARPVHSQPDQPVVARAGDAVQDHAGDGQVRLESGESQRGRRRRLRLSAHVQHQHHRPFRQPRQFRAAAMAQGTGPRHPVVKAHRAFG